MPEASFAFFYFIFAVIFAWCNILTQDVGARAQIYEAVVGKYKATPFARAPRKVYKDIETPASLWDWLVHSFMPVSFLEISENGQTYGFCTTGRPCYLNQGACHADNQCAAHSTCSDRTAIGEGVMVNGEYWDRDELETWCEYSGTPIDFTLPSGASQPCDAVPHITGNQGPCCWDTQTAKYITSIESIDAQTGQPMVLRSNCPSYLESNIDCCALQHSGALRKNETDLMQTYMTNKFTPARVSSFNHIVYARVTMKLYKRRARSNGMFRSMIGYGIGGDGSGANPIYHNLDNEEIEDKSTFTDNGVTYRWTKDRSYQSAGGYSVLLPGAVDIQVWKRAFLSLWMAGFFDPRMGSFVMDVLFYNGNADTFFYLVFIVEFDFTGTATTQIKPSFINLNAAQWKGPYLIPRLLELILAVLVIVLLCVEVYRVYESSLKVYFSQPVRVFDVASLLLCTTVLTMQFAILGSAKYHRFSFQNFDSQTPHQRRQEVQNIVELMDLASVQQFLVAVNLFMIFIRAVMLVTKLDMKLGLIVNAVSNVGSQLLWFSVMFLMLLSGFVGFAYVVFGINPESTGMSSLMNTFYVIFSMLVGGANEQALAAASATMAPIFFFTFYVVLLFVMINMFVSILLSGYDQADFDLQHKPGGDINVLMKFVNELKGEVIGKTALKVYSCLKEIWKMCLKPFLQGMCSCAPPWLGKTSDFKPHHVLREAFHKRGRAPVTPKTFDSNIAKAEKILARGRDKWDSIKHKNPSDDDKQLHQSIGNMEAALESCKKMKETFLDFEVLLKKQRAAPNAADALDANQIDDKLDMFADSIRNLRDARVAVDSDLRRFKKAHSNDVWHILLFWLTFISMMITLNRAEVSYYLTKATTHSFLSTHWFSARTPSRTVNFYDINTFEDVGEWAQQALTKLYEVPVCNSVAGKDTVINDASPFYHHYANLHYAGSCSAASCGGTGSYLKWTVEFGTADFEVKSVFEPLQLQGTALDFVMYSARTQHVFRIYGNPSPGELMYIVEGVDGQDDTSVSVKNTSFDLLVGQNHTMTLKRHGTQAYIYLDGIEIHLHSIFEFVEVTAFAWRPGQNTIRVHLLEDNFKAKWQYMQPGEEVRCDVASPEMELLQSINSWNVGFLNYSFIRITVQPACFRENEQPRWRSAANFLRTEGENDPCANKGCFVEAKKKAEREGSRCFNSEGDPISRDSGVVKEALDAVAPYEYDKTDHLGTFQRKGGLVFNLGNTYDQARQTLQKMEADAWFSKNSASMAFDWIAYNGNFDVFVFNVATFSLLPTGKLEVAQKSFIVPLNLFVGGSWYWASRIAVFVLHWLYALAVVYYVLCLFGQLRTERVFQHAKGQTNYIYSYYSDFWNLADSFSLLLSLVYLVQFFEFVTLRFRIEYKFATSNSQTYQVPRTDEFSNNLLKAEGHVGQTGRSLQDEWYIFSQFEDICGKYYFLLNTAALNSLFMSLRVLQNVNRYGTFAVFANTLGDGARLNSYFLLVIALVFIGWTLFFTVLFGHVDFQLSNVMSSLGTMFEWMLGSFDNTNMLEYNTGLTIFCFVCFQIFMKFVAINMFLATMLNTYSDTVGNHEKNKVSLMMAKEREQTYATVVYSKTEEFEKEITIKRDEKGDVHVEHIRDGKATQAGVQVGHLLHSINGERDEWKLFSSEQEIVEESINPAGRDNQIHIIFKDPGQKQKTGPFDFLKRSLSYLEDETTGADGGPKPTVKNFWRRHGAVSTVSNEVARFEAMRAEALQSESENRDGLTDLKALEDEEYDEMGKESTDQNVHVDERTSRGRVKKRLEGLLFSRANHVVSKGSDPFDIANDELVAQEFTPGDDGKKVDECELDELRTRISQEPVTGWEVWLDCLITQIEREPEMDVDSVVTEVLRTGEMRELRKGTTSNSNVLRDFYANASDILSILEFKAKKRYFTELKFESEARQRVLEEQNKCMHDYACILEGEFQALMENMSGFVQKRDQMKGKLHGLIGQEHAASSSVRRSPRRALSPREQSEARARMFNGATEADLESDNWNYAKGTQKNWSWASGRWPGHDPVSNDQTHV